MNNIKINVPEGMKAVWNADHTEVTFEPLEEKKATLLKPKWADNYFYITTGGQVLSRFYADEEEDELAAAHYNVFPKLKMAEKASRYQRMANAIISACLQVDPDFEPDWTDTQQAKYAPCYNNFSEAWMTMQVPTHNGYICYVSTREKASEVCAILEAEGIQFGENS